jgi:hypothetical protein
MEERLSSGSNVHASSSCDTLDRGLVNVQSLKKRKREDEQQQDNLRTIEARVSAGLHLQ